MDLPSFNALPHDEATEELLACCGSRRWAASVAGLRPYRDLDHLLQEADEVWRALDEDTWLEAIEAHPRIGERAAGGGVHARWSAAEQADAQRADEAVRDEIARLNVEYERRFEHVFLISAAGRSGEEILAELRRRLDHSLETELEIATEEQAKITRLRLERLIEGRWTSGGAAMDDDLESLSREELIAEVARLRAGIRRHRDASGQDLCWHHPALWDLLPEKTPPAIAVPPWPKFLRGCIRYRQSLDEQAPAAPFDEEEYDR